jgi:hypothetical protein
VIRRAAPWIVLGGLVSGISAALVATTHDPKAGRAGLVWIAADALNVFGPVGESNPIIVAAAVAGGVLLVVILACVPARQRWILGALFAGFGIAQGASSEVWQRYHEPFALLFLAISTMVAVRARRKPQPRTPLAQAVPIAVLALGMSATTAMVLWQREIAPWRRGEVRTPVSSLLPDPPSDPAPGLPAPE